MEQQIPVLPRPQFDPRPLGLGDLALTVHEAGTTLPQVPYAADADDEHAAAIDAAILAGLVAP